MLKVGDKVKYIGNCYEDISEDGVIEKINDDAIYKYDVNFGSDSNFSTFPCDEYELTKIEESNLST